jgi:hypothetical protein
MHRQLAPTVDRGATSIEMARDARARAWAYVWDCYRQNKGTATSPVSRPDSGTKVKEDSANERIIQ